MSRAAILFTLAALGAAVLVFAVWPGLDIAVARQFLGDGGFWGASAAARAYRHAFYGLPIAVMAYFCVALLAKGRVALPGAAWIDGRGLAFMALSMALGPGLVVNVGLKDHWHRPRPVQIVEFGGPMEFRPIWRGDGACKTNCSFPSGEVSSSTWLLAPASLAPPPLRAPAMAAAFAAIFLTALGRLAFGGHFLSDAVFAFLITALVTQALYRLMIARRKPDSARVAPPARNL